MGDSAYAKNDLMGIREKSEESIGRVIRGIFYNMNHIYDGCEMRDPSFPEGDCLNIDTCVRNRNPFPEYKTHRILHNALRKNVDKLVIDCLDDLGPQAIDLIDSAIERLAIHDKFDKVQEYRIIGY